MKKHVHALILAAITILYAVIAFTNLGNINAPQTFVKTLENEQFIFDLGEIQTISRINYFAGIGKGEFEFEVSRGGERWNKINTFYTEDGEIATVRNENGELEKDTAAKNANTNHFTWHISRVDAEARFVRITALKPNTMLHEFAFYNGNEQLPIVSCTAPELADEQAYSAHSATYKNGMYFDEVYFGRTAYEILNQQKIYETTHPPLGKLLITFGIWMFGMVPFGWRFMGALAGILMIPAIYLLANQLFKNKTISLVAASLLALDFMHFSLTRMATIDSFPVLFIILTFYYLACYVRRVQNGMHTWGKRALPLIGAGIFLGLASASKWIGLYIAPGIFVILMLTWWREYKLDPKKHASFKQVWGGFFALFVPFLLAIFASLYIGFIAYTTDSEVCKAIYRFASVVAPYAIPLALIGLIFLWIKAYPLAKSKLKISLEIWWHFFICCGTFIIIPAAIYAASYVPQLTYDLVAGQSVWSYIMEYQKFMYNYHVELSATHNFASPAISWPIIFKPLWAFMNGESVTYGLASSIVIMGNPAIWWTGLAAVIALVGWAIYSRRVVPVFISCMFFTNYLSWLLVPRVVFIYHYFASVPGVILAICYWANFSWDKVKVKPSPKKWTRKIPAWGWSAFFGGSTALALYLYHLSNQMVRSATSAQHLWSGIAVAVAIAVIVYSIMAFDAKLNAQRAKPEEITTLETKTVPAWAWIALVGVSLGLFVWFYPILSGKEVSLGYAESLHWFKSWIIYKGI